jgi:hypothetical protein
VSEAPRAGTASRHPARSYLPAGRGSSERGHGTCLGAGPVRACYRVRVFSMGTPSCSPTFCEGLEFLAFGSRELAKLC